MLMPRRNHQTESFERLNSPLGEAKGTPFIGADGLRQSTLFEKTLKGGESELFPVGFHGFAQQEVTRSVIGDSQRIAILIVAELELAFVIGAPERVWTQTWR
jgi:hypothetical protein